MVHVATHKIGGEVKVTYVYACVLFLHHTKDLTERVVPWT